jgi:hypothetical protein
LPEQERKRSNIINHLIGLEELNIDVNQTGGHFQNCNNGDLIECLAFGATHLKPAEKQKN